jgi:hypothetical protein
VFRRLTASLLLVACLLGIVQPALACANAASRSDCCPAGSSGGSDQRIHPASPSIDVDCCCALRAAVTPSASAIRGRTDQGHASGLPTAVDLPTMAPLGQHVPALNAPAVQVPDHLNQSLTFLRTARLRL